MSLRSSLCLFSITPLHHLGPVSLFLRFAFLLCMVYIFSLAVLFFCNIFHSRRLVDTTSLES